MADERTDESNRAAAGLVDATPTVGQQGAVGSAVDEAAADDAVGARQVTAEGARTSTAGSADEGLATVAVVARVAAAAGARGVAAGDGGIRALPVARAPQGTAARGVASGLVPPAPEEVREVAPERPRPISARRMVGPVHLAQLIWLQLTVLTVLATWERSTPVAVAGAVSAGLVLVVTVVPVRRRWLWQWLGIWLRFLLRRRAVATPAQGEEHRLPSVVRPGSVVGTLVLDDQPVGVIEHPGGVTVLLTSAGPAGSVLRGEDLLPALSPADVLGATPADGPQVTAQLVVATIRPDRHAGPHSTAYAAAAGRRPSSQGAWVALQLPRTVDRYRDADLADLMGHVLGGVVRRLGKLGQPVRPLAPRELVDVLVTTTGALLPGTAHERWSDWGPPGSRQVGFRVTRWPQQESASAPRLLDLLASEVDVTAVTSLAVRRAARPSPAAPGPDELELEGALRLCAPAAARDDWCGSVLALAAAHGAQLERCDGQHRAAAAATTPFGGFA